MSDTPDFSNAQGGSSSTATKVYEVKSGDSLSKIAKREYGDANAWNRIFEANKDMEEAALLRLSTTMAPLALSVYLIALDSS